MSDRVKVLRFIALIALLLLAGRAQAQTAAPAAIRVRAAHLAPFLGSSAANVTIRVNGVTVADSLAFGARTAYQPLAGGVGSFPVEVLRGGTPVISGSVNLVDGDQSLVLIGDETQVELALWVVDDTRSAPPAGKADLRAAHAAAIGATIDETLVELCSQAGAPFLQGNNSVRYLRDTPFRQVSAGEYDLKVTRYVASNACSGALLIDLPALTLVEGTATTLFFVGDGNNQPLDGFTFAGGLLIGDSPTPGTKVLIPGVLR